MLSSKLSQVTLNEQQGEREYRQRDPKIPIFNEYSAKM